MGNYEPSPSLVATLRSQGCPHIKPAPTLRRVAIKQSSSSLTSPVLEAWGSRRETMEKYENIQYTLW